MEMAEICVEIDEDILERLKQILTPLRLTPEELAERFIRFCADPNNKDAVKAMFDEWRKQNV